jgi:hypothetical protein
MKPSLELHIEQMVLHGFPRLDSRKLREVVQQQLTTLLNQSTDAVSVLRAARILKLDGGVFRSAPGAGVEDIGTRIARKVYGCLTGPSTSSPGSRDVNPKSRTGEDPMNRSNEGGNQP